MYSYLSSKAAGLKDDQLQQLFINKREKEQLQQGMHVFRTLVLSEGDSANDAKVNVEIYRDGGDTKLKVCECNEAGVELMEQILKDAIDYNSFTNCLALADALEAPMPLGKNALKELSLSESEIEALDEGKIFYCPGLDMEDNVVFLLSIGGVIHVASAKCNDDVNSKVLKLYERE